jgi:hypothetical protein
MRQMKPIKNAEGEDAGRFDAGFVYVAKDFHTIEIVRSWHEVTKSQRITEALRTLVTSRPRDNVP